ncbi:MAG: phosphopentomutase, partial [Blastocatellia bacterium]|nr:phosphopentomutase [Blastocatellia bacterium]
YVPLLVYGKHIKKGVNLGTRSTFADLAVTIAEFLGMNTKLPGASFYKEIIKESENENL